jgi:ParB-like chromosome segregation protein Spo0J
MSTATATITAIDPDTGRNPATEKWLTNHQIPYTFDPLLELARIDVPRSLTNQARIGEPLDPEVVDQYENDYRGGAQFPPLLAHQPTTRSKKLVLLGGNHRNAAATKAGLTRHPAYIITGLDPDIALKIAYRDNATHGARLTRQDRMRQAAHLIATGAAATHAEAAATVGITTPDVAKAIAVAEGGQRARTADLAAQWDQLPHGHQVMVAAVGLDVAFTELVKLTAEAKLSQADTRQLVNQVNRARTEDGALRTIGNAREEHAGAIQRTRLGQPARRTAGPTEYGTVNGALTAILNADPSRVYLSAPTPADRARLKTRLRDTMLHAKKIADAL